MSNAIIQSEKIPVESVVTEFENVAVELQALLIDSAPMFKAIEAINELYESELDGEDIQRLTKMQYQFTFDHSHNAAFIFRELGRISAEASALLYVLDNQTANCS